MIQIPEHVARAMLALVAVSAAVWLLAAWRLLTGRPIIVFAPRRAAPWTVMDVASVFVVMFLLEAFVAAALVRLVGLDLATALAKLATLAVGIAMVRFLAGATMKDMGFSTRGVLGDVLLGTAAFLAVLLPVGVIQHTIQWWYEASGLERPVHPVLEMIQEQQNLPAVCLGVFLAVIVAPLAEEFLFRGFLQGWLEHLFTSAAWRPHREDAPPTPIAVDDAPIDAPIKQSADGENPYVPPAIDEPPVAQRGALVEDHPETPWAGAAAILISSLLFALVHASMWPDPIPLVALAMVFGYVYRRTHRLLPCIVAHAMFNALSLLVVWLSL